MVVYRFQSSFSFPSFPFVFAFRCPQHLKFGSGPPATCAKPWDPQNRPPSSIESWFTREIFDDLFPKANLGWGPHACFPYSYESFVIAARYFPRFGADEGTNYTKEQNARRDLAAFFAHAIQETGENDASLYSWFEGGPVSSLLPGPSHGGQPTDGVECNTSGRYFGRGAIQISYNFNYGMFANWLRTQSIFVDLLKEPNLILTKTDPPLAMMASIWFYMTPQPPKPAMHDIVIGNWNAGEKNRQANYSGCHLRPNLE
ncbi:Glycoside hydrolase family 19 domain containing protein [Aphelenchoides fujianensis]|nr:Glycoside hydrolase family 19 domain containing protein [Aphelenchoides fujianensis]